MKEKWWHNKVAYQIYPKSFMDSNQDGIGDLKGIISKLDYLKWLGIDIVWISPIYKSPLIDQGYDISDYYAIDERFGTMDDFDLLVKEIKNRKMYLLMDLVVNHCSDQHVWFQEFLKNPEGKYKDYFIVRDAVDGKEPCNWRSYFGGNVWEKVPGTNKYYLHLFAKEQPDLNWENPVVKEEIYAMMNWWMKKGISGFRVDAIVNLKKDLAFQNMPPDRNDGLCSSYKMVENVTGLNELLAEMNERVYKPNNAFTIAELFNYNQDDLNKYIGEQGYFSTIFDFETDQINATKTGWEKRIEVTPKLYMDALSKSQNLANDIGYMANIIENHDQPRGINRYLGEFSNQDNAKKMLAGITIFLRGMPFLYQGQEIGMENNRFSNIDQVNDIETIFEYNALINLGYSKEDALHYVYMYSRDNARTPVQWDPSKNAGFSNGTPWMVVNDNYKMINVEKQLTDKHSVLQFYRKLIQLRKESVYSDVIVHGTFKLIHSKNDIFVFTREYQGKSIKVIANMSNVDKQYPFHNEKVIVNNLSAFKEKKLLPFQFLVIDEE